ncbi:hypothetical protein HAALTHF_24780n [Vreelandella aquamarina]|nr:hypothetical protein HAALTHF_24780n [Halomonas axialensis]
MTAAIFHALGVGFYALLTVLGLGAVMVRFPELFQLITWFGAAYLAWLGIKALRAGRSGALAECRGHHTASGGQRGGAGGPGQP